MRIYYERKRREQMRKKSETSKAKEKRSENSIKNKNDGSGKKNIMQYACNKIIRKLRTIDNGLRYQTKIYKAKM